MAIKTQQIIEKKTNWLKVVSWPDGVYVSPPVGVGVEEEGRRPERRHHHQGQSDRQLQPGHRQQAEQPEPEQQVDLQVGLHCTLRNLGGSNGH